MTPPPATNGAAKEAEHRPSRWRSAARSTFAIAVAGSLLLWLAQPPAAWGWLAWVAPAPWLVVAGRRDPLSRGGYVQLWLAGVVYWLLAVHWVCLPHPLTPIGWGFLATYLGCYLPAFVWLTRTATRRTTAPLWLAAPVVWTGLEWVQAHLFSGFLMGALSHTQAFYPGVIQIADTVGAYGVSFVMMLTTAAVVSWFDRLVFAAKAPADPESDRPSRSTLATRNQRRVLGAAVAAGCLMLVILHGQQAATPQGDAREQVTVALIQGNTLAVWDYDVANRNREIMERQVALSQQAIEQATDSGKRIDLFVWPESMFRPPVVTFDGSRSPPPATPPGLLKTQRITNDWFGQLAIGLRAPLLMGADRFDVASADDSQHVYNSSVLIDKRGNLAATYDKGHRVPFGEYIPLASHLPALYFMTPMEGGLRPGEGPVAMELHLPREPGEPAASADGALSGSTPSADAAGSQKETIILSPNICYETVIPHVIHGQVRELTNAGTPPDLLVNLTNDAWFWGYSELDMHLACDVFRAVETRTPMIVAANGGLSAVIDASGRVLAKSERQQEQALVADAPLRRRSAPSFYVRYGDWFASGCLIVCGVVAIIGVAKAEGGRRKADE